MSEAAYPATHPLAESFQRCSRSFKELYLALFAYGPISLSKFNDEYGRFGVWGGDSGADRTGRGSLDDVLRNDSKTTSIIAELLKNLDEDLNSCPQEAPRNQSPGGQEWLSDEESSVSSGSEAGDGQISSRVPNKTQRILHLLAIIVDHIQSLFQVSTLLRRPIISDKYLRSSSKRASQESESPFLPWDLAHIAEKRQCWINAQKWHPPTDKDKPEDIPHQKSNYLCKRLATANVRRREQLNFWQTHPAEPSALKLPKEPIRAKPAAIPDHVPTRQPLKAVIPRSEVSKPTHGTKQSFSTVAKSDLNDAPTFSGRPRTEYVSSSKGGRYALRVPPVPKVLDGTPTLQCPYCSTTLDAKSLLQRELWKKHVFRDLRPYVCTFEGCKNPEKLYLTRHDWMYHETQMHHREWTCTSCSHQKFFSRNDMKSHLLANHSGNFPEAQLRIVVDICERPMDDDEDADCPFCLVTLALSALRVHLATHLEELALFVLPCHMEDRSQEVGSDKAEGAPAQHLASDASHGEDGLAPLDFEESLPDSPHSQNPEMFSALLDSKIESGKKYIDDWFSRGHQTEPRVERHGDDGLGRSSPEARHTYNIDLRILSEQLSGVEEAFPTGHYIVTDSVYDRVNRTQVALMESLQEMLVKNLPPEVEIASSLTFLDGAAKAVHDRKRTDDGYLLYKRSVYHEISRAWATIMAQAFTELSEPEFRAWGEILMAHHTRSGGSMSVAVDALYVADPSALWLTVHDGGSTAAIAPPPEVLDPSAVGRSAQRTKIPILAKDDIDIVKHFFSKVAEARQLQRTVEQLAANIIDRPMAKSAVTLGSLLRSLETLTLEGIVGLDNELRLPLQQTCDALQSCIECMQAIVESAQGNICQPASAPDVDLWVWKPGMDIEAFAENLEQYTETLNHAVALIAENYLEDLQAVLKANGLKASTMEADTYQHAQKDEITSPAEQNDFRHYNQVRNTRPSVAGWWTCCYCSNLVHPEICGVICEVCGHAKCDNCASY